MTKDRKIYFGWWVLIGLAISGFFGGMSRNSLSAFFPFISSETGWSRSTIGFAQSLCMWLYGIFVLFSGWMTDKFGGRKTIIFGSFVCLLGWVSLSKIRSTWELYSYYSVMMALTASTTHSIPTLATARKWFVRRSGLASGIIIAAAGLGIAILTPIIVAMSKLFGWRIVSVICGIFFGITTIVVAFFYIRDNPESIGLKADIENSGSAHREEAAIVENTYTVTKALKAPEFWLLLVAYGFFGIPVRGVLAHLVMWGIDLGSTPVTAGILISAMEVSSVFARVGGGWLGDRYGKKKIMIIGNLFCMFLMLWAWYGVKNGQDLMAFAILMGIGYGMSFGLFAPYVGDLFGRANVGFLFAAITVSFGLIGGWGPFIWGAIADAFESYNLACLISSLCYAIVVLAILFIRPNISLSSVTQDLK
jgi:MFS family permease